MEHWSTTEEIKNAARGRRRRESASLISERLVEIYSRFPDGGNRSTSLKPKTVEPAGADDNELLDVR